MKRVFILTVLAACLLFPLAGLTLPQCLDLAKQHNLDLLSAKEDIIMADQQYKEVRGYLLPQVSLQGGYQLTTTWLPDSSIPGKMDFKTELDENASSNDSTLAGILTGFANGMIPAETIKEGSIAGQLKLTQILFSGGKLINGLNAVKRYRSIQKLRYTLQEQDVIAKTTEMFYQTMLANKVSEIQQQALDTANQHLNRVEILNREGQVSEYDLLRARLEVAKLRPNVVAAHNTFDLALSAFRKQIGIPDSVLTLEGDFILPETQSEDLTTALSLADKQRIELKLTDINTQIMQIRYNAEKGNYLPDVALSAGYSLFTAADEYAIEAKDFGTSFNVGIGFSLPIFTGLSNSSKRVYAHHGYFQAQLKEKDTTELIALQVRQTWQNLQNSLENYQVQVETIRMAERSLQLAQIRFENQVGIQLEVFDAQIMLNSVRLSYYNSIYEVINANQQFRKAMGYSL
jgi:outer membrane protein